VVGGGPTGVELAGALAELKRHVLPHDYPDLDLGEARVILLEATDRLLGTMPRRLQRKAREQLEQLGVEVRFGAAVDGLAPDGVVLKDGARIASANVIWVAGVRGEPLGGRMQAEVARGGRVRVDPTLQLPHDPRVYVAGDLAYLEGPDGRPYPMLAQAAMQQATLAAKNILRDIDGRPPERFRYHDRGTMATIGRAKAVAHVFGLRFSGFLAWSLWLGVHLVQIIGLRNRAFVLMNWAWNYVRYDRANRLVTDHVPAPQPADGRRGEAPPERAAEPASSPERR
jgi:NADH dehydrogenase